MRIRFLTALLIAATAAISAAPAGAQSGQWVKPPDKLPHVGRGDKTRNLDFLFGALKVAPDDVTAKAIEERIWALWTLSPSDTANLLMTRVKTAIEAKDLDLAVKLLNSIVKVKPDYVEAWNRRATIYYMKKDYGRALNDIREVLKREPRHFGALSGLGMSNMKLGRDAAAADAFRRLINIDPLYPNAKRNLKLALDALSKNSI